MPDPLDLDAIEALLALPPRCGRPYYNPTAQQDQTCDAPERHDGEEPTPEQCLRADWPLVGRRGPAASGADLRAALRSLLTYARALEQERDAAGRNTHAAEVPPTPTAADYEAARACWLTFAEFPTYIREEKAIQCIARALATVHEEGRAESAELRADFEEVHVWLALGCMPAESYRPRNDAAIKRVDAQLEALRARIAALAAERDAARAEGERAGILAGLERAATIARGVADRAVDVVATRNENVGAQIVRRRILAEIRALTPAEPPTPGPRVGVCIGRGRGDGCGYAGRSGETCPDCGGMCLADGGGS